MKTIFETLKTCTYNYLISNETLLTSLYIDMAGGKSISKALYELTVKSLGKDSQILKNLSLFIGLSEEKSVFFFKYINELVEQYLINVEKIDKKSINTTIIMAVLTGRKGNTPHYTKEQIGQDLIPYVKEWNLKPSSVKDVRREAWRLCYIQNMDFNAIWDAYNQAIVDKKQELENVEIVKPVKAVRKPKQPKQTKVA